MRKPIAKALLLASVVLAAAPAFAQRLPRENAFRVHAGLFTPDGNSDYWDDNRAQFSNGDAGELEGAILGADFRWGVGRNVSLLFSVDSYGGDTTRSYLDFEDNRGNRIRHDARLDIASATAGVVFQFAPDAAVRPYVGIGGGLYAWQIEEEGDFINFNTPNDEIFTARLASEGVAPGGYVLAGLEVPISRSVALFAEGKWTSVEDELDEDLENLGDIDLSGQRISAGLSWSF